jgi:hypothetical protein
MELEVASARTTSVSDVPAFLTEHLRRRLMPAKREVGKKEHKTSKSRKWKAEHLTDEHIKRTISEQGRNQRNKRLPDI